MKIKEFLSDRKYLILFFSILMAFICTVVYLEEDSNIRNSNVLYLLSVSTVLFLIYLTREFLLKRNYCNRLTRLLASKEENWPNNLPTPPEFEQRVNKALLVKLYNENSERLEKLYDKNKEELEFLTAWVHQIKTPIAVCRLIIENNLNYPTEKTLYSIEEEIDKIEDNVQKALFFSRVNDFANDYIIGGINMEALIKEVIKKHSKTFINKNIGLEIGDLNHEVYTDKKWMTFIADQVMGNALKYTDHSGTVKAYMEIDKDEKLLHIEDTGIGIKPEDIGRVFNKSFTGYNGRDMYSSTGLGLYLSQKLAKRLGHYITIVSGFREGTKVTIHFPKWENYFDVTKM